MPRDFMDIISRLEKADGPSRELDADIAHIDGVPCQSRRDRNGKSKGRQWMVDSFGGVQTWAGNPPAYTASLDAAISLTEKMLPEAGWQGGGNLPEEDGRIVAIFQLWFDDGVGGMSTHKVPAIALLLALFTALQEGK